ncbi:hypothetical protein GLOTRDRAFT_134053 [Gloeophyllum trabeum ATCC 11539]|uniref:DUF4219 domain-containing protein n=1 Tax=Gloeophyllum trabeum (strain ATCC 11539 / FP-39264 / Madison 617) TaxID=670483 RepID=S7PSE8_GLOTA|nr:uncharacterized protein GLOTRDRAFT_134053 [Gloeophyllum trabeum ATCC 11539]EPQ50312.1 hypothetical protein GLOTRDRAFT_134053 [Gloeophyllum trabeum ATCC 11539]
MSDANKLNTRFAKLNDTNYGTWAIRMEAIMIRMGMDEVKAGAKLQEVGMAMVAFEAKKSKRNAKKMQEARVELILTVEDSQLAHMRSADPMDIWMMLAQVHRALGFAQPMLPGIPGMEIQIEI